MEMPVLTCLHCGAKLMVKPAALRFIKEIPCGKCRKKFAVTDEMKAEATAHATTLAVATPAAPATTPPAPAPAAGGASSARVDALEARVVALEATITALRAALK
ncbi:MAG: hypothetical protein HN919_15695 [Verrucomicrobia bacterium]|nr:hypothetical protein [Verrucomicrobiota bacterium]